MRGLPERRKGRFALLLLLVVLGLGSGLGLQPLPVMGATLALELQRRDPTSGEPALAHLDVDPSKAGVVVVDMWNWHWCKTSTARVAALVPRMRKALEGAHELGMTVFWCPSDVADNYVGTPQHEAAMNTEPVSMPPLAELQCPPAPDGGGCTCGPERCQGNYGWDGMHPDLVMSDGDFMPNDVETLYAICRKRGLTHLIYMGVHTQVCLLGKSIGLRNMTRAGFQCILARDLTDAHGKYDPASGYTPDRMTSDVVAHFEKHLAATINFAEELGRAGKWDPAWVVDPVRIAPWGTPMRPHLFENRIVVTLTAPWQPRATIHYTLDGTSPTAASPAYSGPFEVSATTHLRAAAFEGGRSVCLPSEGYFARLGPMPRAPDVYLSDLEPLRSVGPGHSPSSGDHRFSPVSSPPRKDLSNRGSPLRLRGKGYDKGLGVHAPNQMIFAIKPGYARFVALVGADDRILDVNSGSNLARYPSIVFKVFVDGKLAEASPVLRISEQPWRFDIPLPEKGRRIELVATDAGDGNREDLGDWVQAGFVLKPSSGKSE